MSCYDMSGIFVFQTKAGTNWKCYSLGCIIKYKQ